MTKRNLETEYCNERGDSCFNKFNNNDYTKWLENKLILSGVIDNTVLETMHNEIFNEFHELRKKKGNSLSIEIDGKEVNEIIRLGKLKAKSEHCL